MKEIILALIGLVLFFGVIAVNNDLRDLREIIKPLVTESSSLQVVHDQAVYYNNVKVNGDCALVDPPCWTDFYRHTVRLQN